MSKKHSIGIVFGPNGAGKGTLAEKLSQELGFGYLNMGNAIRDWLHNHADTPEGIKVRNMINEGDLVGDDLVSNILLHKFANAANQKNFIFDGFPRRNSQMDILKKICEHNNFEVKWIIMLNISLELVLERVSNRIMTPDGHVYHTIYNPPPANIPKSKLKSRKDDRPHVVEKRYKEYMINTLECLSNPYLKDALICNIDASGSIEEVRTEALTFIKNYKVL